MRPLALVGATITTISSLIVVWLTIGVFLLKGVSMNELFVQWYFPFGSKISLLIILMVILTCGQLCVLISSFKNSPMVLKLGSILMIFLVIHDFTNAHLLNIYTYLYTEVRVSMQFLMIVSYLIMAILLCGSILYAIGAYKFRKSAPLAIVSTLILLGIQIFDYFAIPLLFIMDSPNSIKNLEFARIILRVIYILVFAGHAWVMAFAKNEFHSLSRNAKDADLYVFEDPNEPALGT
ncbi:MAG: hypothetical protein ACTSYI_17080 [Promethearchaeota archaeon]